jgi:hypothetical protein
MSDISPFPMRICGASCSILSVANLTREDGLASTLAPQVPVRTTQVRTPGIKGATDRPVAPD